jgi:hypothetical protein
VPRSGTALDYAAELEELSANPLDRVKWKPPKVAEVMDRRVVINPGRHARLFLPLPTSAARGVAVTFGRSSPACTSPP